MYTYSHVNYVDNSLLLIHDLTVSKLSEGMEYFRSMGTRPLSEGMCGWIPVIKITQEQTMKIKLEITMDNGSIDNSVVDGNPAPESIMELMNKLKSLHDAAVAAQSSQIQVRQATQPTVITPPQTQTQVRPQPQIQPTYTKQSINQPPQHKPQNIGGTRNLQIAEEEYSRLKNESLTIKQRLELFLNFEYTSQWFTSLEVKRDYDRVYGNINLSTVSTYLSRMYRENKLERMGNRNQRKYHIRDETEPQEYSFGTVPYSGIRT